MLIEALRLLKVDFQSVRLMLPGSASTNGKLLKPNYYERYILKKIVEYGLQNNVVFIGRQSAAEVANRLRKAHVCVVSSAMEGASATICEGMMIGTPCICAYRGGMTDLLKDGISGFYYDFPEYSVLADRIKTLFLDRRLCQQFSEHIKYDAMLRHDRMKNIIQLKQIYQEIWEKEK